MPDEFDALLSANEAFASSFASGDLPAPPARRLAVITCMDARLHPERFLGLELGDAHVIRNAGGRASDDAIRSLVVSQTMLGTREVLLIQHTDCGMQAVDDAAIAEKVAEHTGSDASHLDFLTFSDLEQNVRDDVGRLRDSALIAKDISIVGAIYDVKTGRLSEVTRA